MRVGGDFALQFQGLSQYNDSSTLIKLSNNFTLPTANLNLDVQLERGVRLHMRTYLSARHHTEAWVKGGYMQIDDLGFIEEGFLGEMMKYTTFRVGMDDIGYGDAVYRRSDNASALYNPFVGNYIMDTHTTEPFVEAIVQMNGYIGMIGWTNGRLNQTPKPGDDGFVLYGKLGYDKQLNEELRVRLTGSIYHSTDKGTTDNIYGGDRAGSRYYLVMHTASLAGDFEGRFNPKFAYQTAYQINPFVKFRGLEFFGIFENVVNGNDAVGGYFTHLGAEVVYRIGKSENFYVAGRYNNVTGQQNDNSGTTTISRLNFGAGWFMTSNVVTKLEYVSQSYSSFPTNSRYYGGEFSGLMLEAVISF